jgi:hypothetical protein
VGADPRKEVITMRVRGLLPVVLAPVAILAGTFLIYLHGQGGGDSPEPAEAPPPSPPVARKPAAPRQPTPVALNRGRDVAEGFRGDVHPLLFGETRLPVTAQWTRIGKGRDGLDHLVPTEWYALFTDLQPEEPRRIYTESAFSAFLPARSAEVGQLWALDGGKIVPFLTQFHARPSLQLVADGRRAGPNGAFAILRAVSPSYLDVVFRMHAEFRLLPESGPLEQAPIRAWYTPAYFTGRVLVNRQTGTVEHFHLGVPTDKALNVHLTLSLKGTEVRRGFHEIVRVEHMELTGGDGSRAEKVPWTTAISRAEADRRLAKVFYRFREIDWVPFDEAATRARDKDRPIFAVVSWGSFDDQSC